MLLVVTLLRERLSSRGLHELAKEELCRAGYPLGKQEGGLFTKTK